MALQSILSGNKDNHGLQWEFGGSISPVGEGGGKTSCLSLKLWTTSKDNPNIEPQGGANIGLNQNELDGLVAQQVQAGVQKQSKAIYEIGSLKYYMADARPGGRGTITHLLGLGTSTILNKLREFADVCQETRMTVGAGGKCRCKDGKWGGDNNPAAITYIGGFLTGLSSSMRVEEWYITNTLEFTFVDAVSKGA